MSNTWKELDAEQKREAPPTTCRYCGEPIYWEALPGGKKKPVNATDFDSHRCNQYETEKHRPKKEAEMPTNKGKCSHGEFILTEGCPQCIAERQAREAAKAEETVDRDTESLAENQQGQLELATDEISPQEDESYRAPYNAAYHAPYRLQGGSIAPGVTTVLKVLDKGEGLPHWSWDLGRQGIDYREVRDAAARVGTFTHQLIACHLQGEAVDSLFLVCSQEEREKASRCFAKYLAWEKKNPLTPVMIEERLVSEEFKYGGTPDLLAEIDGEFVLLDFKTGGSGIYSNMFTQLAAYWKLLQEQGWPVANARILRISADESDAPEEKIKTNLNIEWEIFLHCLAIYQLQQERTLCS